MKFVNRYVDISREMTETAILGNEFAEIRLDWFSLPYNVREELVRECLCQEIEYDDQWFFLSIIIPAAGAGFDLHNTYFYIDELPPDEQIYKEIANSISENGGDLLHRLYLSAADTVQLISGLIPGISMTA